MPASWHVHVFFPSPHCTNCSEQFLTERSNFTLAGAMELRGLIATELNALTRRLTGKDALDPIDASRAVRDPAYNQCGDTYHIVAGAPANYHREPCIFEVDMDKKLGPFTDPVTSLGYPNYSFLLPGATWLPGLLGLVVAYLRGLARSAQWAQYAVLLHPNSGCEVRDHVEAASIDWLVGGPLPLLPEVFSCRALGCNQACPAHASKPLPPPANCTGDARERSVSSRSEGEP